MSAETTAAPINLKAAAIGECRCMQCDSLMDRRHVVVRPLTTEDHGHAREISGYCQHCRIVHCRFQVCDFGYWVDAGISAVTDLRPVEQILADFHREPGKTDDAEAYRNKTARLRADLERAPIDRPVPTPAQLQTQRDERDLHHARRLVDDDSQVRTYSEDCYT